jgi:hypothetical protein
MTARRRGLSAGAGVGSQDQLEVRREAGMHLTAAKCDHAGLQRRTQRLEDSWLKRRRLQPRVSTKAGAMTSRPGT